MPQPIYVDFLKVCFDWFIILRNFRLLRAHSRDSIAQKIDLLASLQTVKIKYRAAVLCVNGNKSKKVDHVSQPYSNIQNTPLKSKCCFSSHKRERFTLR